MANDTRSAGTLHVTNGDAAVEALRGAGFEGVFLPWRDVLHDGPVPAGRSVDELAAVRALFIANQGWEGFGHALRSFRERDRLLERLDRFDEVLLWFEHDLYDQLQLIQVLDRIADSDTRPERLSMTVEPAFLSLLPAGRLLRLYQDRRPVTEPVLAAATSGWDAFRDQAPSRLAELANTSIEPLPFLANAFRRLLEEYPAPASGLSRTEQQIIESLVAGFTTPAEALSACLEREDAAFMGDASFWEHMQVLLNGVRPLLEWRDNAPVFPPLSRDDRRFAGCRMAVTAAGHAALAGELDHAAVNRTERWIGGVHLRPDRLWRYDRIEGCLIAP